MKKMINRLKTEAHQIATLNGHMMKNQWFYAYDSGNYYEGKYFYEVYTSYCASCLAEVNVNDKDIHQYGGSARTPGMFGLALEEKCNPKKKNYG